MRSDGRTVKITVKVSNGVGTVLMVTKRIFVYIWQQYILQCNSVHIPQLENMAWLFHFLQIEDDSPTWTLVYQDPAIYVQVLRFPGVWDSQNLEISSPIYRPSLSPWNITATVRLAELCQWTYAVTPSAIKAETFRNVAQCLIQLCGLW
jgi:hypothetical protein